jgi:HYR domain-containing protein
MRISLVAASALAAILLGASQASAESTTGSVLLQGYEGVPDLVLTSSNASVFATVGSFGSPWGPPQSDIFISTFTPDFAQRWQIELIPPIGTPFAPGTYTNAGDYADAGDGRPVLVVFHIGGVRCTGGTFTINSLVPNQFTFAVDADWQQLCGGVAVSGHAVFGEAPDTVPPGIEGPAGVGQFVLATMPSGAAVTYDVSARDAVDPSPRLTCEPPSGSVLRIGQTSVTCTATDSAGNSASLTFAVFVIGAEGQLLGLRDALMAEVNPAAHGPVAKVEAALAAFRRGSTVAACNQLGALEAQLDAVASRLANAGQYRSDAERIARVLGC